MGRRSFFCSFIGKIYEISSVIYVIDHLVDLRLPVLCIVVPYRLFVIVFECSIPAIFLSSSALFMGHKIKSTTKYMGIVAHIIR